MTGGGTGGHVSPALSVVATLRHMAESEPWVPLFLYVGSASGIEQQLADQAGLAFVSVQTGKLRRATSLVGMLTLDNLLDAMRVPLGVLQALYHLWRFRPNVLFSTGGFVAVPTVLAAAALRIPVLIHEQTIQIGLANRICGRFARRIALSYENARSELAPQLRARSFVTGNPVRAQIFDGDRERAVDVFGFSREDDGLPTVYVTGGVQGAHVINEAVRAALPRLLTSCRLLHQCGEGDYEPLQHAAEQLPAALRRRYHLTRFVSADIGHALALADLVVSRGGAGTIAELCALGKPSILVPLEPSAGDEQRRNARHMVALGASVLLPQGELDADRLLREVNTVLSNPTLLSGMANNARRQASPQAARLLAQALLELARGR